MKKNTIYIALVALFIIAAGLIVYKYNNTAASKVQEVYSLLPRTGSSAQSAEWAKVKEQSFRLLEALKANNKDTKSLQQAQQDPLALEKPLIAASGRSRHYA